MKINRALIFHLLYALEGHSYDVSLEVVIDMFNNGFDIEIDPESREVEVARAILDTKIELDQQLEPLLANWKIERVGVCTKLILRLALWELVYSKEPAALVINEAVELAKCFAEKDAYKFVNGVLDEARQRIEKERDHEVA